MRRCRKSDKLTKSVGPSGARSPGPVRRGDGIDERDAKDRGREREDKEKERKERKEKKEKEKEDKRKEREEKERERREKEREKREKGREERERKEKEKEERKEKKKEKLLNKKKIETSGGGGSKLRSREGSNSDLTIDYVAAASAALEAAELPLPPNLVERPLSNTTSATVVAVDATKEQETDKPEKKKEKEKDGGEDDGGDDGDDDDNLVVDVQSVGASTATLPVVEESTDPASHTTNETTSAS